MIYKYSLIPSSSALLLCQIDRLMRSSKLCFEPDLRNLNKNELDFVGVFSPPEKSIKFFLPINRWLWEMHLAAVDVTGLQEDLREMEGWFSPSSVS